MQAPLMNESERQPQSALCLSHEHFAFSTCGNFPLYLLLMSVENAFFLAAFTNSCHEPCQHVLHI